MIRKFLTKKNFVSFKKNVFKTSTSTLELTKFTKKKIFYSSSISTQGKFIKDSFGSGNSTNYLESIEKQWEIDPKSVNAEWNEYFQKLKESPETLTSEVQYGVSSSEESKAAQIKSSLQAFLRSYQSEGHQIADLDPLGLYNADLEGKVPDILDINNYPLLCKEENQDLVIPLGADLHLGFLSGSRNMPLKKMIKRIRETYCGKIGVQYTHISNREQTNWIRSILETETNCYEYDKEKKLKILERLTYSDSFERFLAKKFPTAKRFGLEGCESLIPGLKFLIDKSSELGVDSIVMGMPHRGRLNVLSSVLRKGEEVIFKEFRGEAKHEYGSGDVKYHLGSSTVRVLNSSQKIVHISLVANPSHLEAVNPVVVGKVRAKQHYLNDTNRDRVLSLLIHGDAAFAGQGVNYETSGLAELQKYTVGGTIHVVVNNQIGFTTNPRESRSSPYCTDLSKYNNAPIFHVNADDPEAVVFVFEIAALWRKKFKKDVVIDLVCYRRHGHNELDQPKFTQPKMYSAIEKHPPTLDIYSKKLIAEKVLSEEEYLKNQNSILDYYEDAFQRSKGDELKRSDWFASNWRNFCNEDSYSKIRPTGVKKEILREIGIKSTEYPSDLKILGSLKKILEQKRSTIESGKELDWATAESLAFGSLLTQEKYHVRLSGQDCERGTFSHRHAVLVDQETERKYIPLDNLTTDQNSFRVCNSSLSEFGVLGFEYGYSLENPYSLVCWEAQFGDFSNGAQIIIDQFISSGEDKWLRQSGIVLLLPHGYEGMGPEHSSCRIERYLQLSSEDSDVFPDMDPDRTLQIQKTNWQVLNCTTPANYFHALRRQCLRDFRKPLVIATPKFLLRYKLSTSTLDDMDEGTFFQRLIPDNLFTKQNKTEKELNDIKLVIFCSGKVYYDLFKLREEKNLNVPIIRIEQLSPFPFDKVHEICSLYKNAEITWCQEEPKNMGAWTHVYFKFLTALKGPNGNIKDSRIPRYCGRRSSASPSTGYSGIHALEQELITLDAFNLEEEKKEFYKKTKTVIKIN